MQRHVMDKYKEQYGSTLIKLDPYLIRSISIIPNQTFLRLKGYNIAGVLAFISFVEVHLIGALSEREILLLQGFIDNLGAFLFAVDRPGLKDPLRMHIPVSVGSVETLPGRPNIAIIKLKLRNAPPDLLELICGLFDEIESRKAKYERYADDMKSFNDPDTKLPGLQSQAELIGGGKQIAVNILSMSTTKARVTIGTVPEGFPTTGNGILKIKGPAGFLTAEVEIPPTMSTSPGVPGSPPQEVELKLGFSNDIISLIDAISDRILHLQRLKAMAESKAKATPGKPAS